MQVNAGCEMLFNVSAAHLVGRPLERVMMLPPGYRPADDAAFSAYDVMIGRSHKALQRVDFISTPFADHAGWQLVALHGGAMAHRMGQRAGGVGARTAVGIAAMLAHEIKNPLSGISGAAQLLQTRVEGDDVKMTQLIRTEVDRITALIDRMEGFTDTRPPALQPDNIHEIIDHARRVALNGFGSDLAMSDSFDPSLPQVMVDRDSMIQIILNLIKNAAETAQDGERRAVHLTTAYRHGVSVAVEGKARKLALPIEFCVIDDGPGAPPEIADNLFDPFVSSKKSGRGLGLALVDKMVRDQGGIIQYSREGDPERTVFRVLLPRVERSRSL